MEITTNNIPRPVLYWEDLTAKERAEFDYDPCDHAFFRYRGGVYDLGEFSRIPDSIQYAEWAGWHSYRSVSYLSGVLVRWDRHDDAVIVARYRCL